MSEPITLLSHDALDELVDVDPIKLRDEAFKMRAEVERLSAELGANRQRWYHNDQSRTECVAGFDPDTRECSEGGGKVFSEVEYQAQLINIWTGLTRSYEDDASRHRMAVIRVAAERDQAREVVKHTSAAMVKVGAAIEQAMKLAASGDAVGAAAVLADVASEESAVHADAKDGAA